MGQRSRVRHYLPCFIDLEEDWSEADEIDRFLSKTFFFFHFFLIHLPAPQNPFLPQKKKQKQKQNEKDLFIYQFLSLSLSLTIYLSIYLSQLVRTYLPIYLSIYLSPLISIYLSIYLSQSAYISLSASVRSYLSIHLKICFHKKCDNFWGNGT